MSRWPFKRRHADTRDLDRARADLAKARADEIDVAALVEAHRRKQRENHFGPRIARAIGAPPR